MSSDWGEGDHNWKIRKHTQRSMVGAIESCIAVGWCLSRNFDLSILADNCILTLLVFHYLCYYGFLEELWPPVWGHSCGRTSSIPIWRCNPWCWPGSFGHESRNLVNMGNASSTYYGTTSIFNPTDFYMWHAAVFTTMNDVHKYSVFSGNNVHDDKCTWTEIQHFPF